MKIILGMTKSNLDMKGCKSPKLELDFLRLLYAKQQFKDTVICHLLVTTDKIAKSVDLWRKKYNGGEGDVLIDSVENLFELPIESLKSEKRGNAQGMMKDAHRHLSNADFGKEFMEACLEKWIRNTHENVPKHIDGPLGVNWDYSGKI